MDYFLLAILGWTMDALYALAPLLLAIAIILILADAYQQSHESEPTPNKPAKA